MCTQQHSTSPNLHRRSPRRLQPPRTLTRPPPRRSSLAIQPLPHHPRDIIRAIPNPVGRSYHLRHRSGRRRPRWRPNPALRSTALRSTTAVRAMGSDHRAHNLRLPNRHHPRTARVPHPALLQTRRQIIPRDNRETHLLPPPKALHLPLPLIHHRCPRTCRRSRVNARQFPSLSCGCTVPPQPHRLHQIRTPSLRRLPLSLPRL